ncbi:HOOK protein-domain-containing protein [Tuber brumale]|nr:HOOK protein-domain-containing protein [Tuber brumale]
MEGNTHTFAVRLHPDGKICVRPGPTLKVVFFFSSSSGGRVSPGKCTCTAKDMAIFRREGMMRLADGMMGVVGDGVDRATRRSAFDYPERGMGWGKRLKSKKFPSGGKGRKATDPMTKTSKNTTSRLGNNSKVIMSNERAVAAALVDWINACPIEPKISNLGELSDGSVITKVLLKRLHKELTKYYTENLGHRLPSPPPNLTLIAKDSNVEESIKLAKIVVASAVQSEKREEYIQYIQELSPSSQTELMGVISEMMEAGGEDSPDIASEQPRNDTDHFRLEEEMARLVADNEAVKAKNKSLEERLASLQNDFEENQAHLLVLQDQLSRSVVDRGGYANRTDPIMRSQLDQLQSDVQKLEDVIAEKESTIGRLEGTISGLNRRVEDLFPKAEAAIKYKDDLDEANHTIDKLKKSQNVAEKYRKKLEGMGEMERAKKGLEQTNGQMEQELRACRESLKQVPGLKRTLDQYKKQVDKIEAEYVDLLRAKTILEIERNTLREKAAGAEGQKSKDMERIQNLEERNHDATKAKDKLEQDYLQAHTGKLILEAQLAAINGGSSIEGSEIMLKLRQNLVGAEEQLIDLKRKFAEVDAELSMVQELILSDPDSKVNLVGKDKLEALAELKVMNSQELIELRGEHEEAQNRIRGLEAKIDQKKTLLNTVLLEKDEISKKLSEQKDIILENEKSNSELRATVAAFQGTAEGRDAALEKRVLQLQGKLEDQREKMVKAREHIKKQNGIIRDLKEKVDTANPTTPDANTKSKEEQLAESDKKRRAELEILERENKMIVSAWYDQATRLQMNSVALERKGDTPHSWLNKQRAALAKAGGV